MSQEVAGRQYPFQSMDFTRSQTMDGLFGMHKGVPFGWAMWLPMAALWLQAALSAYGRARRTRDQHKRRPAPPRLMAPR